MGVAPRRERRGGGIRACDRGAGRAGGRGQRQEGRAQRAETERERTQAVGGSGQESSFCRGVGRGGGGRRITGWGGTARRASPLLGDRAVVKVGVAPADIGSMSTRFHELGRRVPGFRAARGGSVRDDSLVERVAVKRAAPAWIAARRGRRWSSRRRSRSRWPAIAARAWTGAGEARSPPPCSSAATPSRPASASRSDPASPSLPSSSSSRCSSWRRPRLVPLLVAAGFALSTLPEHLRGERASRPARPPRRERLLRGRPGGRAAALVGEPSRPRRPPGLILRRGSRGAVRASTSPDAAALGALGRCGLARALRCGGVAGRPRPHSARPGACGGRPARPLRRPARASRSSWLLAELRPRSAARASTRRSSCREAYLGTALLLGDVVEADDSYTGCHSRDVVTLVLAVCRPRSASATTSAPQGRVHRAPARRREGPRSRRRSSTSPAPLDPARSAPLIETHTVEGQRMLEPGRRAARGRRAPRPLLPRALGRRRLPRSLGGRGHPARRSHRVRLRRLERHDDRSQLPRRPAARRGRRRAAPRAPGRSSIRGWSPS